MEEHTNHVREESRETLSSKIDTDDEEDEEEEEEEEELYDDAQSETSYKDDPPKPDQEDDTINESMQIMRLSRKKALLHFRCRVEDAILGNYLLGKSDKNHLARHDHDNYSKAGKEPLRDISLWSVPLLPSAGHEGTDIILLKFLKASGFKVSEAFHMLQNTLRWRKENKVEQILDEKFPSDLEKLLYINSTDMEGRPLCYHAYGVLKDMDSCRRMFGSKEKCEEFFRWTVHFMEKSVKKNLSFKPGGVDSMVHIMDLKNLQKSSMKELRYVLKSNFILLQDNYPELIHKHVMINVPFWYYTFHVLILRFIHQSNKNKFIFARPSRVTKTLLKFVAPEDLPVQYGGLKRENDSDFSQTDKVSEAIVRKNSIGKIQIPVHEAGVTVAWDLTVVGWDSVSYKEEFIPDDECSYKILIRMMKRSDESMRNSFYISEPGKIMISIDNRTYKKKRVLYRTKTRPTMYIFFKS
ncbi:patellin-4-like [Punica granatum]|uniref:Patellin-4-like n=1 Tax=Punica granatum TaxID=22663 RepID=A0A6P8BMP3_PUNGR|nr:patellin-4-like [Punica granatum]